MHFFLVDLPDRVGVHRLQVLAHIKGALHPSIVGNLGKEDGHGGFGFGRVCRCEGLARLVQVDPNALVPLGSW